MKKIFIFILLLTSVATFAQKQINITDLYSGKFYREYVDGIKPMADGESYTILEDNCIIKFSYKTGVCIDTIANLKNINYDIIDYEFSVNEDKILFYFFYEPIHRNSFYTLYYIYDLKTKEIESLYENPDDPTPNGSKQQQAIFSPDGTKVGFIVNNNLLVKDLNTKQIIQVTNDGEINKIINGIPDWVYEEEFAFNRAFEFSPDSKKISYIKFDESQVREYMLQFYYPHPTKYNRDALYTNNFEYKYPKAGENNSVVSVNVFDFESNNTIQADLGDNIDIYIPEIQWTTNSNILSIVRMNRLQNKLDLLFFNTINNTTSVIYTQTDPKYIEETVAHSIYFLNDGKSFLIQSEQNGYRHIYKYSIDGKLINAVTSGKNEIINFYGVNEKTKKVYYSAVGKNPSQISIYCVDISGKNPTLLSSMDGTNSPEFSSTFKYFINTFSNINTPDLITVNDANGKILRVLEDNSNLKSIVNEYGGVNKEIFFWKNSKGDELTAYIIKPKDFDSTKKYPVLVCGYNGPNNNFVNDEWEFGWHELLAQKGYIVASTDTRGTGRKGSDFRKSTYLNLGKLETEDLIDFSKYLGNQSYIDGQRLGIWGWSYGGFMATNLMTRGAGSYKVGIAVAPVTDWQYYDNIYTERYMQLPQNNYDGYLKNSPFYYADKLEGKLLLIYGSADDNVHPQNSIIFAEALVQANKQFDFMQYTNRNHSIYGGNTRIHLYTKMTDYILENL
ncbi:MAG: S9 family peptidase [Bacteroidales bacterium]|nr:S9 family peptidase [Bacteroidales bacterium]